MIRQNMRVTVIDVYMILYFNQKNTFAQITNIFVLCRLNGCEVLAQ